MAASEREKLRKRTVVASDSRSRSRQPSDSRKVSSKSKTGRISKSKINRGSAKPQLPASKAELDAFLLKKIERQKLDKQRIDAAYKKASSVSHVSEYVLKSQDYIESKFEANAVSSAKAEGWSQFRPATAKRFGLKDLRNPYESIEARGRYMKFLMDTFNNDQALALAGYNAGEQAVIRYKNKIPPYAETQNYVRDITKMSATMEGSSPSTPVQTARPVSQSNSRPVRSNKQQASLMSRFNVNTNKALADSKKMRVKDFVPAAKPWQDKIFDWLPVTRYDSKVEQQKQVIADAKAANAIRDEQVEMKQLGKVFSSPNPSPEPRRSQSPVGTPTTSVSDKQLGRVLSSPNPSPELILSQPPVSTPITSVSDKPSDEVIQWSRSFDSKNVPAKGREVSVRTNPEVEETSKILGGRVPPVARRRSVSLPSAVQSRSDSQVLGRIASMSENFEPSVQTIPIVSAPPEVSMPSLSGERSISTPVAQVQQPAQPSIELLAPIEQLVIPQPTYVPVDTPSDVLSNIGVATRSVFNFAVDTATPYAAAFTKGSVEPSWFRTNELLGIKDYLRDRYKIKVAEDLTFLNYLASRVQVIEEVPYSRFEATVDGEQKFGLHGLRPTEVPQFSIPEFTTAESLYSTIEGQVLVVLSSLSEKGE